MLVVVEDRYVERLAQPRFDLEAARSRNVLEVDATETRGDRRDRAHDLIWIGGRKADRPRVDAAELLEQNRLALHHRQSRLRADVSESEHRRAVGDDRDGVFLGGQTPDALGIVGNCAADARNARRVGHREIVARFERHPGRDFELAAAVEQQGAVGDVLDLDSILRAHGLRNAGDMRLVDREDSYVTDLLAVLEPYQVDGVERSTRLADRRRHSCECTWAVVEVHAEGRAEGGRGMRRGHPPSMRSPRIYGIRATTEPDAVFPHYGRVCVPRKLADQPSV